MQGGSKGIKAGTKSRRAEAGNWKGFQGKFEGRIAGEDPISGPSLSPPGSPATCEQGGQESMLLRRQRPGVKLSVVLCLSV